MKKYKHPNIIHKAEATPQGVYYMCIHAVGKLDIETLLAKTNWKGKKITCKNCRKRYLNKREGSLFQGFCEQGW